MGKLADAAAEEACKTTNAKKSCKAKYDKATGPTSKIDPLCPACLDAARRTELFAQELARIDELTSDVFCCAGTTTTVPSSTTTLPSAVCGNGVRESGEDCDDANTTNLDGCNATCGFEQSQRAVYLSPQFGTDTVCPTNRFGSAFIGSVARQTLQQTLATEIADGSISILLHFLALDDLSGSEDAAVSVGILTGTPVAGTGYDGTNDVDWWYTAALSTIDADRLPTATLPGAVSSQTLSAGPGSALLPLGTLGAWEMSALTLTIVNGATSTPAVSTGGPPGHLPEENLDPSLQSWETSGATTDAGAGTLCGRISAESLSQTPIPSALTGCSFASCSQCYTSTNSLLDLIVGGCNTIAGVQVSPSQPDTAVPGDTVYSFTAGSDRVVNGCTANGVPTPINTCLEAASYSVHFKLGTNRVLIK